MTAWLLRIWSQWCFGIDWLDKPWMKSGAMERWLFRVCEGGNEPITLILWYRPMSLFSAQHPIFLCVWKSTWHLSSDERVNTLSVCVCVCVWRHNFAIKMEFVLIKRKFFSKINILTENTLILVIPFWFNGSWFVCNVTHESTKFICKMHAD